MAMTPPDALFRAAMNRLIARVGEGVADAAAGVAVAVQDAPDRIRQEWDLFQEEVKAEAERATDRRLRIRPRAGQRSGVSRAPSATHRSLACAGR